ncbi:hypothetical protein AWB77_03034 [Caballeronia fortuita]|uniref:Glycosyltransferase RgtA/B/C/D-like domain-containing protein n=1 Tax=Caballeronia fortuita TaxID=1777138 RepID=A0A158BN81_9BURK|nr:hypothetical protein [Caballeronia fortuita]SAK71538.1 hypothetical protein AWB77_03034 [Caballeronia fortuita]
MSLFLPLFRKVARSNITALAYIAVLCAVFSLHLFTGLADNGDFSRTFGFLIEGPAGWPSGVPVVNSPEWNRRFFHTWINDWSYYPHLSNFRNFYSISSQKAWMLVQAAFSIVTTGSLSTYSVIAGSIPGRLVYVSGFIAMFHMIRRNGGHRAAWTYLFLATPIMLASAFAAFLNSFFEEQMMIFGLPVMAVFVYLARVTGIRRYAYTAIGIALVVGLSKTAYFLAPMIVAPFVWQRRRGVIVAAAVATALAFMPAKLSENRSINQYHALYYGALKVLKEREGVELKAIGGKPVFNECVGVIGFTDEGGACMRRASPTYADTARVLLAHPRLAAELALATLNAGNGIDIPRDGLQLEGAPSFAGAPLFRLWSVVFAHHMNVAAFVCAALALGFRRRLNPLAAIGLMFSAWGLVQYGLALADGFIEIEKHLIGANYSLTLALLFFASSLAWRRASPAGCRNPPH